MIPTAQVRAFVLGCVAANIAKLPELLRQAQPLTGSILRRLHALKFANALIN